MGLTPPVAVARLCPVSGECVSVLSISTRVGSFYSLFSIICFYGRVFRLLRPPPAAGQPDDRSSGPDHRACVQLLSTVPDNLDRKDVVSAGAHGHARAQRSHARTRTHTHTCTRAHTWTTHTRTCTKLSHTHTHTHICTQRCICTHTHT